VVYLTSKGVITVLSNLSYEERLVWRSLRDKMDFLKFAIS